MNIPEKLINLTHEDSSLTVLSDASNVTVLIDAINTNAIRKVREILEHDCLDINAYSEKGNAFYLLLLKYEYAPNWWHADLLTLFINNPSFKLDIESIRSSIRVLASESPFHEIILDFIKKQRFIVNLNIRQKTEFILILSEYFHNLSRRKSYKKYIQLFSVQEILDSQNYLIHNFESFFVNYHYSQASSQALKNKTRKLVQQILVDKKDFTNIYKDNIKQLDEKHVYLGEDIKYSEMIVALIYFNCKQHKVKDKKFSCLFKNPKKFFTFFSLHIRTHKHYLDNDIDVFLKDMQMKYNLSSINWDNRYFYNDSLDFIKGKIETSIIKTLSFFNLKDLSPIHLQFKSPPHHNYNALFWNTYNYFLPKNIYTIQIHQQGLRFSEESLIHEMTHYLHFHPNNKKCFRFSSWKILLDKIYLHKEREVTLGVLSEALNKFTTTNFQKMEIESIFEKNLHLTELNFIRKTTSFFNNLNIEDKTTVYDIFKQYKLNVYQKSLQFVSWKKAFEKHKFGPHYLNRKHEIHARLNEILSGQIKPVSTNIDYLTNTSVPFEELKEDLTSFNTMLLINIHH